MIPVLTYSCVCVQGDRFGGALDAAAKEFSEAYDAGMIAMEFVNSKRKKGELIMGIGHRVKSVKYLSDNNNNSPTISNVP